MKLPPHQIRWVTAAPLWPAGRPDDVARMNQPALLEFKSDKFMDELTSVLQSDAPVDLTPYLAKTESFRPRPAGEDAENWPPAPSQLKLYQPAHGRHYLVGVSLVCRLPGLPDHPVDKGAGDKAGFVMRRLVGGVEYAWQNDDSRPPVRSWQAVTKPATYSPKEELLPLYPVLFPDGPRKRKLLVGLIPTTSRETYVSASVGSVSDGAEGDLHAIEAKHRVIEPLQYLIDHHAGAGAEQLALEGTASQFIALDLADFLRNDFRAFWDALARSERPSAAAAGALYDFLTGTMINLSTGGSSPLRAVLMTALAEHAIINGDAGESATPSLAYDFADTFDGGLVATLSGLLLALVDENPLPADAAAPPQDLPKLGDVDDSIQYVLRAVYRQPQCGPRHPDLVGAPSLPFTIASYFDFDAPARPIRIVLPFDPSIAGLRKFKKNVAMLMSKKMRKALATQVDFKTGNVTPGPAFNFGEICSFSIPILTIVAMILLMIVVGLLNLVFWWIPLLKLCFPIPSQE